MKSRKRTRRVAKPDTVNEKLINNKDYLWLNDPYEVPKTPEYIKMLTHSRLSYWRSSGRKVNEVDKDKQEAYAAYLLENPLP